MPPSRARSCARAARRITGRLKELAAQVLTLSFWKPVAATAAILLVLVAGGLYVTDRWGMDAPVIVVKEAEKEAKQLAKAPAKRQSARRSYRRAGRTTAIRLRIPFLRSRPAANSSPATRTMPVRINSGASPTAIRATTTARLPTSTKPSSWREMMPAAMDCEVPRTGWQATLTAPLPTPTEAIRLAPRDAVGYRVRGLACVSKSEFYKEALISSLRNSPTSTKSSSSLTRHRRLQRSHQDRAHDEDYSGRGYVYYKKGNFARAVADLSRGHHAPSELGPRPRLARRGSRGHGRARKSHRGLRQGSCSSRQNQVGARQAGGREAKAGSLWLRLCGKDPHVSAGTVRGTGDRRCGLQDGAAADRRGRCAASPWPSQYRRALCERRGVAEGFRAALRELRATSVPIWRSSISPATREAGGRNYLIPVAAVSPRRASTRVRAGAWKAERALKADRSCSVSPPTVQRPPLGRAAEARAAYLMHRDKRITCRRGTRPGSTFAEDFDALRKAGLDHRSWSEIEDVRSVSPAPVMASPER